MHLQARRSIASRLSGAQALVLSTEGLGCEALLGWWRPPEGAAAEAAPALEAAQQNGGAGVKHEDSSQQGTPAPAETGAESHRVLCKLSSRGTTQRRAAAWAIKVIHMDELAAYRGGGAGADAWLLTQARSIGQIQSLRWLPLLPAVTDGGYGDEQQEMQHGMEAAGGDDPYDQQQPDDGGGGGEGYEDDPMYADVYGDDGGDGGDAGDGGYDEHHYGGGGGDGDPDVYSDEQQQQNGVGGAGGGQQQQPQGGLRGGSRHPGHLCLRGGFDSSLPEPSEDEADRWGGATATASPRALSPGEHRHRSPDALQQGELRVQAQAARVRTGQD